MDETKETQTDSLPEGKAPEGSEGTTPEVEAKTHTEKEKDKAIQLALIKAGRDAKSLSDKEVALKAEKEAIEAEKAKLVDWERRRDQAELDEARRDPDKLAAWQKRQTEKTRDAEFTKREADLRKNEADLRKREAEHEAEITAARETKFEMSLFELGGKYEINPTVLKDTTKDLGLTTVEQIEALAKRLSETGKRPSEAIIPASGVISGSGKPSPEQLDKMSMDDYAAHRKKEDPNLI